MDIFLEVLDKLSSWLSLLPRISAKNIVEIAIISFLVYELLVWIKNTRAWTLLKGLLVIFAFFNVFPELLPLFSGGDLIFYAWRGNVQTILFP